MNNLLGYTKDVAERVLGRFAQSLGDILRKGFVTLQGMCMSGSWIHTDTFTIGHIQTGAHAVDQQIVLVELTVCIEVVVGVIEQPISALRIETAALPLFKGAILAFAPSNPLPANT